MYNTKLISTIIYITCFQGFQRPPLGATYSANINFYVLGRQNLNLHIRTKKQAEITLDGIIKTKDTISYNIDKQGLFSFELPPNLQNILNKFYVSLKDAKYENDYAQITVFVRPIRFRKKIILCREPSKPFLKYIFY